MRDLRRKTEIRVKNVKLNNTENDHHKGKFFSEGAGEMLGLCDDVLTF